MAAKKRIRKHDLKEDRFVTATFQFTSFVRERQNTFLTVLAGLVILIIVTAVYTSSRSRTQETAARIMGEVNILYQEANYQGAVQQCQIMLDQYGKTREAGKATIFLADSYLKLGEYQKALETYQLYIDKYHQDEVLTASSFTGIAACHEQLGQFLQAAEFYWKAAEKFPDFFGAPEALMNSGRCFAAAGEINKAKGAYTKLIDNYPESRYFNDAKMAAAEIG